MDREKEIKHEMYLENEKIRLSKLKLKLLRQELIALGEEKKRFRDSQKVKKLKRYNYEQH